MSELPCSRSPYFYSEMLVKKNACPACLKFSLSYRQEEPLKVPSDCAKL